jgi:hypothetical protein
MDDGAVTGWGAIICDWAGDDCATRSVGIAAGIAAAEGVVTDTDSLLAAGAEPAMVATSCVTVLRRLEVLAPASIALFAAALAGFFAAFSVLSVLSVLSALSLLAFAALATLPPDLIALAKAAACCSAEVRAGLAALLAVLAEAAAALLAVLPADDVDFFLVVEEAIAPTEPTDLRVIFFTMFPHRRPSQCIKISPHHPACRGSRAGREKSLEASRLDARA